jgi:hypothetical protein
VTPQVIPTQVIQATPPPPKVNVQATTFTDEKLGVSFTFPSEWQQLARAPDAPEGITIHGPPLAPEPEPIIFAITVESRPVGQVQVKDLIEQQIADLPENIRSGIKRISLTVGSEMAEQVVGLPSEAGDIETFVIHSNQLYHVVLVPYDERNDSLKPYLAEVKSVYDALLDSLKFLK